MFKVKNFSNPILILLLGLVGFAIYLNALGGDFLIDDTTAILKNEQIHDINVFFKDHFELRPGILHDTIRVVTWHLWQDKPFYYHLLDVLTHVSCVILLFFLLNILFNNKILSFLSAFIFAIHPIHTEVVSWISGSHYAFSTFLFMASFLFYIKSDKSRYYLILAIFSFILCFFASRAVATLPLIFIGYDLFFRKITDKNKFFVKFRILVLTLLVVFSAIFIGTKFFDRNKFIHLIFQFRGFNYLIVSAKAFVYYLKILYLPVQRGLVHPFAFNVTDIQRISPAFFLSIGVVLASIVAFFKCRRSLIAVSFGIMWFFITYVPYSNIIPICNIISERYLYLPSVGSSIILAALILKVWGIINRNVTLKKFLRIIFIICLSLFLGSYIVLTVDQNYEYNNIITYWKSNITNFDDGYLVYNNLAGTYYAMGNLSNAINYCRINLMINPNQAHVWYNLGKVYMQTGDYKQAKISFENVLKVDKGYLPATNALNEIKTYAK